MPFKNAQKTLTTAETDIYVAPASTDAIVISGVFSNTDKTSKANVHVSMKLVQGSVTTFLLTDVPIAFGGSLTLPKIVVKPTGKLVAFASDGNSNSKIDVTLGILEQASE